jgi:hypothetical protein
MRWSIKAGCLHAVQGKMARSNHDKSPNDDLQFRSKKFEWLGDTCFFSCSDISHVLQSRHFISTSLQAKEVRLLVSKTAAHGKLFRGNKGY